MAYTLSPRDPPGVLFRRTSRRVGHGRRPGGSRPSSDGPWGKSGASAHPAPGPRRSRMSPIAAIRLRVVKATVKGCDGYRVLRVGELPGEGQARACEVGIAGAFPERRHPEQHPPVVLEPTEQAMLEQVAIGPGIANGVGIGRTFARAEGDLLGDLVGQVGRIHPVGAGVEDQTGRARPAPRARERPGRHRGTIPPNGRARNSGPTVLSSQ